MSCTFAPPAPCVVSHGYLIQTAIQQRCIELGALLRAEGFAVQALRRLPSLGDRTKTVRQTMCAKCFAANKHGAETKVPGMRLERVCSGQGGGGQRKHPQTGDF